MRSRTPFVFPALLALVLGLSACRDYEPIAIETIEPSASASSSSGAHEPSESPSPSGKPSASSSPDAPKEVTVSELEVGNCIIEKAADGDNVGRVSLVDCATPHDRELVYIGQSTMSTYDKTALVAEVDASCLTEVTGYIGSTSVAGIAYGYYYPSETAWNAGNYSYYCFAEMEDGSQSTGSVKDGAASTGGSGGATSKGSETT